MSRVSLRLQVQTFFVCFVMMLYTQVNNFSVMSERFPDFPALLRKG